MTGKRVGIGGGVAAVGGGGLLAILHAAGVLFVSAGHSIEAWGPKIGTAVTEESVLGANLRKFADENRDDEILKSALCQATSDAVQQKPFDVEGFMTGELARGATGIPFDFPQEKIDAFETTIDLSSWNSGIASRYARACLFSL
jgi:hypothetical protein